MANPELSSTMMEEWARAAEAARIAQHNMDAVRFQLIQAREAAIDAEREADSDPWVQSWVTVYNCAKQAFLDLASRAGTCFDEFIREETGAKEK